MEEPEACPPVLEGKSRLKWEQPLYRARADALPPAEITQAAGVRRIGLHDRGQPRHTPIARPDEFLRLYRSAAHLVEQQLHEDNMPVNPTIKSADLGDSGQDFSQQRPHRNRSTARRRAAATPPGPRCADVINPK